MQQTLMLVAFCVIWLGFPAGPLNIASASLAWLGLSQGCLLCFFPFVAKLAAQIVTRLEITQPLDYADLIDRIELP